MLFAEYVENVVLTHGEPHWWLPGLFFLAMIGLVGWFRFIAQTKKTNRDVNQLQNTVKEQQTKIDELKRALEDMKRSRQK